ncbi:Protein ASM-3 a [Aphelenchoides avenae]|nr:Protein ASM-3 a [Aphelenchus avenae]
MRPMRRHIPLALLAVCCAALAPVTAGPLTTGQDNIVCDACKLVTKELGNVWGTKILQECLPDFIVYMCTQLHIQANFICKGIVSDFADEFIYVLNQIITKPQEVCGLLVPGCYSAGRDPLNATWSVPLPEKKPPHRSNPPPTIGSKPVLKVLHISDLHVDYQYAVGTEGDCGNPQCCRTPGNYEEIQLGSIKNPAGYWGHVGNCDVPYWTVESMMQHIAKTHKDIDYVVVSGDMESHVVWNYTKGAHEFAVRNISSLFRKYFPTTNTYFAIGNHEGVPVDNVAPHSVPDRFHSDWLYTTMAEAWSDWVPQDQIATVKYRASYSKRLFPGLRLISLNNILGDSMNFFLYMNQTDPDGQMSWFVDELSQAEAAGDKVHVVAHIPPGDGEALEGWSLNYLKVVNR